MSTGMWVYVLRVFLWEVSVCVYDCVCFCGDWGGVSERFFVWWGFMSGLYVSGGM